VKRFSHPLKLIRKAESAGGAEKLFWLKCLAIKADSNGSGAWAGGLKDASPAQGRHSELLFQWRGRATFVVASGKQLRRMRGVALGGTSELLNIRWGCAEKETRNTKNNAFLPSQQSCVKFN